MPDPFASFVRTPDDPPRRHFVLVADDGVDIDPLPRAVYCAQAGTITLQDELGVELPYDCEAGEVILLRPVRVTEIAGGVFYGLV